MRFSYEIPQGVRKDTLETSEFDKILEFDRVNDDTHAPIVSVCIPLYNYARFIENALDSVQAQTLEELDLCVVDDASTDDSLVVACDWITRHHKRFSRASVFRNRTNCGPEIARNNAFQYCRTEFVFPLDADNILYSRCLSRCLSICIDADCDVAFPIIEKFGEKSGLMSIILWDPKPMQLGNLIDTMALIRKAAWSAVGGYKSLGGGWEDYDFWCKFFENGFEGIQVPEILARYRVHSASRNGVFDASAAKPESVAIIRERHPWLRVVE
jgi:glycosyltransferase involved in cell wall biosynthesis